MFSLYKTCACDSLAQRHFVERVGDAIEEYDGPRLQVTVDADAAMDARLKIGLKKKRRVRQMASPGSFKVSAAPAVPSADERGPLDMAGRRFGKPRFRWDRYLTLK
jgi:hypothetical protein